MLLEEIRDGLGKARLLPVLDEAGPRTPGRKAEQVVEHEHPVDPEQPVEHEQPIGPHDAAARIPPSGPVGADPSPPDSAPVPDPVGHGPAGPADASSEVRAATASSRAGCSSEPCQCSNPWESRASSYPECPDDEGSRLFDDIRALDRWPGLFAAGPDKAPG